MALGIPHAFSPAWNLPGQIGNRLTWVPPRRHSGLAHRSCLHPRPRWANRPDALLHANWPGGLPQSARFLLSGKRKGRGGGRRVHLEFVDTIVGPLPSAGAFTSPPEGSLHP